MKNSGIDLQLPTKVER